MGEYLQPFFPELVLALEFIAVQACIFIVKRGVALLLHFLVDLAEIPFKIIFFFVLGKLWVLLFENRFINFTEAGFNCGHFGILFREEFKGREQNAGIVK